MKHQWMAYVIVALLSIGAGVAIAGLPNNVSVDATIVAPSTTEPPATTVPTTEVSATTDVPQTTDAPETTEVPPETHRGCGDHRALLDHPRRPTRWRLRSPSAANWLSSSPTVQASPGPLLATSCA